MNMEGTSGSSAQHSAPPAPAQDAGAGGAPSVARKHPTIPSSDVLALLARPSKSGSASVALMLILKCELLNSYAFVQKQSSEIDRDAGWQDILRDGSLGRAIEDMFDSARAIDAESRNSIRAQKDILLVNMSMW